MMPVVPTDLTLGFGVARLMSPIPAEQVADTIIRTLRRPRFEAYAPRRLRAMFYLTRGLLPCTTADWVLRQLHVDRVVIAAIGSPEREAYEARLARARRPMSLNGRNRLTDTTIAQHRTGSVPTPLTGWETVTGTGNDARLRLLDEDGG